jgi:hypothetical protein
VQVVLSIFNSNFSTLRGVAGQITSERGVAFILDLANQCGLGGAKQIFRAVQKPGMSEHDLMVAVIDPSVARVKDAAKDGTRTRRESFLTTPFLSDSPFTL